MKRIDFWLTLLLLAVIFHMCLDEMYMVLGEQLFNIL